jgi:hypothetical protein
MPIVEIYVTTGTPNITTGRGKSAITRHDKRCRKTIEKEEIAKKSHSLLN